MEQQKVERINQLAKLAKERELTAEETSEREVLRREYINSWKADLQHKLDSIRIVDEKGNKTPLPKKKT